MLIQPEPGPGLTGGAAGYESRVGRIETHWSVDGSAFRLEVTVPDGVPADVVLPDGTVHQVVGGTHGFTAVVEARRERG